MRQREREFLLWNLLPCLAMTAACFWLMSRHAADGTWHLVLQGWTLGSGAAYLLFLRPS